MSAVEEAVKKEIRPNIKTLDDDLIPLVDPTFVPFGFFEDLKNIIASKIFYTVYITGHTGNGKTVMVEQACAATGREYIRVNITKETDETDLIGSYELINGDTMWRDGPALVAMKRGAILLLDETDYGSERLLCLQSILEGKGYFNKKRGEYITPTFGFNVMATANTKGKGSDDGRYIGANVLNDAFLERFAITVEQEFPSEKTEFNMLEKLFATLQTTPGMQTSEFAGYLVKWSALVRKTFAEGAAEEVISTRRLTHIVKAYCIFKNKKKALELCLNRFDGATKKDFLDFYSKIDPNPNKKVSDNIDVFDANGNVDQNALVAIRKAAQAQAQMSTPPAPGGARSAAVGTSGPVGNQMPPMKKVNFGDGRNITAVFNKYKTAVSILHDKNGNAKITAAGLEVVVSAEEIKNHQGDLLDETVGRMLDKKKQMGQTTSASEENDWQPIL